MRSSTRDRLLILNFISIISNYKSNLNYNWLRKIVMFFNGDSFILLIIKIKLQKVLEGYSSSVSRRDIGDPGINVELIT